MIKIYDIPAAENEHLYDKIKVADIIEVDEMYRLKTKFAQSNVISPITVKKIFRSAKTRFNIHGKTKDIKIKDRPVYFKEFISGMVRYF